MTEKEVEKSIIQYLRALGAFVTKVQAGRVVVSGKYSGGKNRIINLGGTPGTPDVIACLNGFFLGIEVKRDEKEVNKWVKYDTEKSMFHKGYNKRISNQKEMAILIIGNKGKFICVSSIDDLEKDLKKLKVIK